MRVTESVIAKAILTNEEAKVIRAFYGLESAGKRTKKWALSLSQKTFNELLCSAEEKIRLSSNNRAGK